MLLTRSFRLARVSSRYFAKLDKNIAQYLLKKPKILYDAVEEDPDKEKIRAALQRREKEMETLENNFKCTTLQEKLSKYKITEDGKIISNFLTIDGKIVNLKIKRNMINTCKINYNVTTMN